MQQTLLVSRSVIKMLNSVPFLVSRSVIKILNSVPFLVSRSVTKILNSVPFLVSRSVTKILNSVRRPLSLLHPTLWLWSRCWKAVEHAKCRGCSVHSASVSQSILPSSGNTHLMPPFHCAFIKTGNGFGTSIFHSTRSTLFSSLHVRKWFVTCITLSWLLVQEIGISENWE